MDPLEMAQMALLRAQTDILKHALEQAQAQIARDSELIKTLVHEVTSMKAGKSLGKINQK